MDLADIHPARLMSEPWHWSPPPDSWLRPLRAIWDDWPKHRANFCRGMDPERFLAEIHGYGWPPEMLAELEVEVRRRMMVDPGVPVIEHMLDAAIKVRHGGLDHEAPGL